MISQWCSSCLNGGELYLCACHRALCYRCLGEIATQPNLGKFTCPYCWKEKDKEMQTVTPYCVSIDKTITLTLI
jgi:hypothetical protein